MIDQENMETPVALDVGQCDFDHAAIRRVCERIGARVERAGSGAEALKRLEAGGVRLVLVNRVLDADGADGVELIAEIMRRTGGSVIAMLVSNYPEAQNAAMSRGAAQGFGKAQLHEQETEQWLRQCLGL